MFAYVFSFVADELGLFFELALYVTLQVAAMEVGISV